jgi:class 3 adenylate cyclase
MNPTAIYSKTGKGVQEASGKTSNLSRADRAVLSAIDGKSNVGALYKKFEKTPQTRFDQLIDRLEREGYIREASSGVTSAPTSTRPSAPPPSKPMDVVSDLDFTGVFTPVPAPPSVPKGPTVDLAAKARAEAERRAQEESLSYKARQAAEAKAKAEAEKKAKAEAEARARESASVRSREEAEAKERAEGEAKLRAAQQTALRVAAEEKAKADKLRAEAEAKEKAEAELRQRKEEEERKRREEQARKAREEEEARKRKEEEERKRKEEAERKAREEEEARKRKEEEERKRKEEEERKRKEEAERKAREEEEARKRKEEEERKRKEEAERKAREEEEARKRKEEQEARRQREEAEARRRKEEEEARKRREEEEAARRREEEQAKAAAPSGEKFADSLLADLDNFSERDDAESKAKEEAARKEKEQTERARREQQARAQREEQERKRREDEERARREHERRARELEEAEARNVVDTTSDSRAKRRLAAIVAADVAGYSRLMGIDEEGTLTRFKRIMRELIQPKVDEHDGRIVKTAGDGMLIEFPSVVDAVRFAVQVQTAVANEEADVPPTRQIAFRMGINLGDIIGEDNDVYGDGVNVAARLEGLADKGGICIAGVVYDQIRDKVTYTIEDLGQQKLKNITRPVRAYKIKGDWETAKLRRKVDPDSLPHRPAAPAKVVDDDVVVRDDDLDMDEVKRDEQALTKEALKAQREREREAKRRKKAADADIGPIKIRRRRKWGKPIAVTLLLALVLGVAAVHVVPVETGQYAKVASAAFGRKVKIGAAHMSLVNGPEMRFEGVRIGDIVIGTVRVFPTLGSLFSDKKVLGRVELIGALVPESELGGVLLGRLTSPRFSVARVEAKELRLRGPLALPAFDADAVLAGNGALKSLVLNGPDKLEVKLVPDDGQLALEGSAASLTLPFAPQVTLTDFSLKGSATPEGMTLSEWDGSLLDGTLVGTAQFSWGPSWRVEGTLKFKNVNAAVFAPALLSDGKATGSGSYVMQGAVPAKLGVGARIDGGFTVSKGVLGSFDLSRAIRTAGKETQGTTLFAELSGKGSYDKGAVKLRDVNIAAGALNAGAIVDIAPAGQLSGRIVADVKTAGQILRSTINLAGTVKQPEVKK